MNTSDLINKLMELHLPIILVPTNGEEIHHLPASTIESLADSADSLQPVSPSQDKYILVFDNDIEPDTKVKGLNSIPGFRSKHTMKHAFKGCSANINKGLLRQLVEDPDILFLEKDSLLYDTMFSKEPINETLKQEQQGLWHQTITNTTPQIGDNFSNVHCYVLDTGIRAGHVEFSAGQVVMDYNAISKNNRAQDDNGHGTAVASMVGGKTVGIANRTILHSIKVLDSAGSGYTSDIIAGLNWVLANRKMPAVINISVGGKFSSSLNTAVQNCIMAGIPVICAAGNSGIDAGTVSPANTISAVTVSGYDDRKIRPIWCNYGSVIDCFAPGVLVKSAWGDANDSYYLVSGTSFAAPIVSGIVTRFLTEKPYATPSEISSLLERLNIKDEIIDPGSNSTPNLRIVWNSTKLNPC